jgi:hypothetical protein
MKLNPNKTSNTWRAAEVLRVGFNGRKYAMNESITIRPDETPIEAFNRTGNKYDKTVEFQDHLS